MIAHMDQITVIGAKNKAQELLTNLQSLGVVHIDPLETTEDNLGQFQLVGEDKKNKEILDKLISRSKTILDALGSHKEGKKQNTQKLDINQLKEYLESVGSQVDGLVAERADNSDELELAQIYLPNLRELTPLLAQFEDSKYLSALAFNVPNEKLDEVKSELVEQLANNITMAERAKAKDTLLVAAVLKDDVKVLKTTANNLAITEIDLPERYAKQGISRVTHTMEERLQDLPSRQKQINLELGKLSEQHSDKISVSLQQLENQSLKYEKQEDMLAGKYGVALRGWLPNSETAKVVEGLKKRFSNDIVISTRVADDHHDQNVPVKLDNPGWVKPFEGLLNLFAPPKYGNFDPSWTLAVFFPLFFGMIMGDIGFGLLFLGLSYWMRKRGQQGKNLDLGVLGITIAPKALVTVSTVINWAAIMSIIFGFVFGEFFGNFLEHWPAANPVFYIPGHDHGMIPILIPRVDKTTPMLLISIGFGILQVLGGWLIRVFYGLKHKDMSHVFEGIGMFSGLVGIIVFSTTLLMKNASPFTNTLVIIGMLIFLAMVVLAKMPLMLIELISNSGNILSYLRIFAVGLAAALVANLATDLGFAISGSMPIIGPIIGILVALVVHAIAITLTIIGHALQPLRLNYVEFFTKFGFYDESGRKYNPFRLLGGNK